MDPYALDGLGSVKKILVKTILICQKKKRQPYQGYIFIVVKNEGMKAKIKVNKYLLINLSGNKVSGLLDSGDFLSTLLIELNVKFLLEGHHDLDGIEGVSTKVNELGVSSDLQK